MSNKCEILLFVLQGLHKGAVIRDISSPTIVPFCILLKILIYKVLSGIQ